MYAINFGTDQYPIQPPQDFADRISIASKQLYTYSWCNMSRLRRNLSHRVEWFKNQFGKGWSTPWWVGIDQNWYLLIRCSSCIIMQNELIEADVIRGFVRSPYHCRSTIVIPEEWQRCNKDHLMNNKRVDLPASGSTRCIAMTWSLTG